MSRPIVARAHTAPVTDDRVQLLLRARLVQMMRITLAMVPVGVPVVILAMLQADVALAPAVIWASLAAAAAIIQWMWIVLGTPEQPWRSRAIAGQALGGTAWGLFPWLTMPDEPVFQVLSATIVIAVMTSACFFASALRATYLAFVVPAGCGSALAFALLAEGDARLTAAAILVSMAFTIAMADVAHRLFVESAELSVLLETRATTDALTGLTNRRAFVAMLEQSLDVRTEAVGVAFIDLDGFKEVNDTHGHQTGDVLLSLVAHRLHAAIGDTAVLGRYGGDEFTVLVTTDTDNTLWSIRDAVFDVFVDPFRIDGTSHAIQCSIGIARSDGATTSHDLLRAADQALYAAKAAGGARAVEVDVTSS